PAPAPEAVRPHTEHESDLTDAQKYTLAEQLAEVEHEAAEEAAAMESSEIDDESEESPENGEAAEGEPAIEETEENQEGATEYEPDESDAEIREGILAAANGSMNEPQPETEHQPNRARIESNPRARFQRPMRRGGRRPGGPGRDRGRGGRPHNHRPQAPKRTQLISEMLKAGQEIIVQIAKEPLGKKGARITSHVALPGRYLVYMPTVNHVGVSRKIGSGDKRSRLRHLVHEAKTKYPGGFIVRTAAENASEEEIQTDIDFLGRTWLEMLSKGEQRKAPALLHRDLNLVERILRDHLSSDYSAIWIDNEEEYTKVLDFVGRFQPALVNRVKLYTKDTPIFEELGIQQEIDKSLRPKVWLKSGGYIVINHTEALVAIDVNTGKFVGKGSNRLEDTIVRTNIEAVKEVVRQIRLRDLGGIIVVDFIDMEERKNREKVMHALEDALRSDRAPSKVLPFNEFGLVAITRKRTKQALERVLCQPCPYCSGSGMVKSVPTICYEIQAEARKMALEMDGASITLRVNPEIAKALKTRESALIEELENWTRKSVIIQGDPTLHFEQYDIH
ncbi:MAG: Rne/Rng family ribonuclease, partial [Acidobacteria bacterium]|nr:Rne/Rng family ribonuclease [Acidobacteriota bacterium]